MTAKRKRTAEDRARERAEQRIQLLEAVLGHVAFDGWSDEALAAAGRDLGLAPGREKLLFPDGVTDLLGAFSAWADMKMLDELARHDLDALGVTDRVELGVRARLEALAPHRDAVSRGLGILALPGNCARAAELTHETVDAIWYAAGDRSFDFNWYTKRATLAAVYGATVLYWLADESEGFKDTWDFLHRRLADAVALIKWRKRTTARLREAFGGGLPNPFAPFERLRKAGQAMGRA
jgi:ubiquinone biosynthesis protein COQ9